MERIQEDTIAKAVDLLRQAAPAATVILFGSYGRGDPRLDSDLDFLVVEPEVTSRHREVVRLRNILSPLRISVDVLVVSKETFDYWVDTPCTLYYEAAREGRVFEPLT